MTKFVAFFALVLFLGALAIACTEPNPLAVPDPADGGSADGAVASSPSLDLAGANPTSIDLALAAPVPSDDLAVGDAALPTPPSSDGSTVACSSYTTDGACFADFNCWWSKGTCVLFDEALPDCAAIASEPNCNATDRCQWIAVGAVKGCFLSSR